MLLIDFDEYIRFMNNWSDPEETGETGVFP